jgi:hypothetical protein
VTFRRISVQCDGVLLFIRQLLPQLALFPQSASCILKTPTISYKKKIGRELGRKGLAKEEIAFLDCHVPTPEISNRCIAFSCLGWHRVSPSPSVACLCQSLPSYPFDHPLLFGLPSTTYGCVSARFFPVLDQGRRGSLLCSPLLV